jgi:uncharacterized membrane protein
MQYQKPKVNITATKADTKVEIIALLLLILLWISTVVFYFYLPQTIPMHFNAKGVVDDYSSKVSIFILSTIATIIYIGLTLLNKCPHIFNYPFVITNENAALQYTYATKLMRWLKLVIVILFLYISTATCLIAMGKLNGLGWWFLPLTLILVFSPLVWYIWRIGGKKR